MHAPSATLIALTGSLGLTFQPSCAQDIPAKDIPSFLSACNSIRKFDTSPHTVGGHLVWSGNGADAIRFLVP
jgi:hypothetical protein